MEPEPGTTTAPALTPEPAATATVEPTPTTAATPLPTSNQVPTSTPAPTQPPSLPAALWRGITVAPEDRCSPYDPDDYRYSPSVEPKIVEAQGGIYGPYTGTWFESIRETDIEHIVARSEAHDSGLCAASAATRAKFAPDLLNLTLASPSVNRHEKSDNDVAEWLPDLNQCWYVNRTLQVRREYGLTIDHAEADAADRVLAGCESGVFRLVRDLGGGALPTVADAVAVAVHLQDMDVVGEPVQQRAGEAILAAMIFRASSTVTNCPRRSTGCRIRAVVP